MSFVNFMSLSGFELEVPVRSESIKYFESIFVFTFSRFKIL